MRAQLFRTFAAAGAGLLALAGVGGSGAVAAAAVPRNYRPLSKSFRP